MKKFFLVISVLSFMLIGFFIIKRLPEEILIQKSIAINDSAGSVYSKISTAEEWKQWLLPAIHDSTFHAHDSGLTFTRDASKEQILFRNINYKDSIEYENFINHNIIIQGVFYIKSFNKGAYLIWTQRARTTNLVARFRLHTLNHLISESAMSSLQQLKKICEYESSHHIELNETKTPEYNYLYITDECYAPEISDRMNKHFTHLIRYITKEGISKNGFAFCIYHHVSDTMKFSVCIPVEKAQVTSHDAIIKTGHLEPKPSMMADYHGPYSLLGDAHEAIHNWIILRKKKINGAPIEMYVTGPGEIADSTRWHTRIYYPVE